MKKSFFLFICFAFLYCIKANSQYTIYYSWNNDESPAFEVEDMESSEIKDYNNFVSSGITPHKAMVYINAARAFCNLESAPATIINFECSPVVEVEDSIFDALGACNVSLELINTTTKTIKEVTFKFSFSADGKQLYDIKTGDQFCVLTFRNLKGRSSSRKYVDILDHILEPYHNLTLNDASEKKLFYNKKSKTIKLESIRIKYEDGTISNNRVAIMGDSDGNLLENGPLRPIVLYFNKVRQQ